MAVALALAAATLAALALRLPSLVSTLLAGYLLLVADAALVTWALTPLDGVTSTGLALAELPLLAAAATAWWLRGRPGPPLASARVAAGRIVRDPVTMLLLAVAAAALAYELVLALAVPPNNWDSLTYHLARVAAWKQEHGIHWIANAPTDRMNEFQPLAEQQILFLFVATGSAALFAVPQFVAQLAILAAVFGASRRLGFDERAAACAAAALATFTLVALEASTAQNDLVAASFPAAAACLILGGSRTELVAAGAAVALGAATKLTTAVVWPVLLLLLVARGTRALVTTAAAAAVTFLAVGVWGFVQNADETGHLLGRGGGRAEVTASPSVSGTVDTALHLVYRLFDASVLSNGTIAGLAAAGIVLGAVAGVLAHRRSGVRLGVVVAAGVALAFLAPALARAGDGASEWLTDHVGLPLRPAAHKEEYNRTANEDYSAFGPVGALLLLSVPVLTAASFWRSRRVDLDRLAFALALPVAIVLLAVRAEYNAFLTRFLIAPAALTAPLFALWFRSRAVTAALAVVCALTAGLTLADTRTKKLDSPLGRPWALTQAQAMRQTWVPETGDAVEALDARVPAHACVGAVVGGDEPSYLLWGRNLGRRVLFIPVTEALLEAYRRGLFYVVISAGENAWAAGGFQQDGWKIERLGDYWLLAVAPNAGRGDCTTA
jgi:hypothetical protein